MEALRFAAARRIIAIGIVAIAVLTASSALAEPSPSPTTRPRSSEENVQRFLEDRVRGDPDDIIAQNRLAEIYLQHLRATGDYEWLQRAGEAARRSLASVAAAQNATGLYMRARVEYESHHFATARDVAADFVKIEPGKSLGFALLGDALLEFGDLDQAAEAYTEMGKRRAEPIESESRFARLEQMRGNLDSARTHLQKALEAASQLSPPSPEIVSWCRVESGQLAFNTGDWDAAEKNFQSAMTAVPDNMAALEHLAELTAAQEKYEEAILLYEKVIARTPRPEFCQALGDVYAAMGKLAEAGAWHARARDAYLRNANEGNAHYFHHLAGFFSDTEVNPAEAVKWARRDLEFRHTAAARATLAWALYRRGDFAPAAETMKSALSSGTKDAHILYQAGIIFVASGDSARGREMLAEAARINPRHNSFHVHR
ncbi:MAG: tetratricopeptide repeat protein [Chthoniobacterales bacterium]